eukprot:12434933-Ditylum_brightwellii.AAC.1
MALKAKPLATADQATHLRVHFSDLPNIVLIFNAKKPSATLQLLHSTIITSDTPLHLQSSWQYSREESKSLVATWG